MSSPDSSVRRKSLQLTNTAGLHARAASLVRKTVLSYNADVTLSKDARRAKGDSVIEMLSLCGMNGDTVTFEASGPDADAVLEALEDLVRHKFFEDEFEPAEETEAAGDERSD
ncbi:MAG: HPr family phosphocarrier protein [Planctomycetota bacterium]|nr:MAG: HPr family phosphocarrier protein [Planctomycetota bacterium]